MVCQSSVIVLLGEADLFIPGGEYSTYLSQVVSAIPQTRQAMFDRMISGYRLIQPTATLGDPYCIAITTVPITIVVDA